MRIATNPVFIVGMQRSGTTLLRSILSTHSNIAIAPETHFINYFIARYDRDELSTSQAFLEFWDSFHVHERFKELDLEASKVRDRILASSDFSFRNVFETLLISYAEAQHKPRFGEKTPHHWKHIGLLLEWFPESRILALCRDPRSICSSLLSVPWRDYGPSDLKRLESTALRRLRRIRKDAATWQNHADTLTARLGSESRVKLVHYEALVQSPEQTIREVCAFIGEEYEADMYESRGWDNIASSSLVSFPEVGETWSKEHLQQTIEPITATSVAKWKTRLTPAEVACIERECELGMAKLGYPELRQTDVGTRLGMYCGLMWSCLTDKLRS